MRLVGLASFPSSSCGNGRGRLGPSVLHVMQFYRHRCPIARTKGIFFAPNGMIQEQERGVSILVWTPSHSEVKIGDPDRAGSPGRGHRRGKQEQTKEKSFLFYMALSLPLDAGFSPRDFLLALA